MSSDRRVEGRGQGGVEHVSERTQSCVSERAQGANAAIGIPLDDFLDRRPMIALR